MKDLGSRKFVLVFVAAAVAAAPLLLPDRAEAASAALFRINRSWHGGQDFTESYPIPKTVGPDKAPPATAILGGATPKAKMTWPRSFIVITDYTFSCVPGTCYPGYPESKGYYSYWNMLGRFERNNPNGASMTTTVRFPTTMSSKAPIPRGSGNPRTPTTTFGGRYDFSRGGSIKITPGKNRFGGTMHFFAGPNQHFYQLITISSPYISKAYGPRTRNVTTYWESSPGKFQTGFHFSRFRMTPLGNTKATTGMGGYISQKAEYLYTIAPWTTGMFEEYDPLGNTITNVTNTGYDNRTAKALSGKISLVRPRLVHAYLVSSDPNEPIINNWSSARSWEMVVTFLPEPGGVLMLGSGILALAGLYRLRGR